MPPKKDSGASKKVETKKKEKIIEDKTFGLKNKNKSKAVQKQIKGISHQVKEGSVSMEKIISEQFDKQRLKKQQEEEEALMASLFKTVNTIKQVGADGEEISDPKQQVCAYFKQGLCQKGKKCKYSHDLTLEAKSETIDLYTDQRSQLFGVDDTQTIEDWDAETLEKVVKEKEKKYKSQTQTEIVCKFFLDSVEKSKYNWNWVCPNGMVCHYRHCLPPGFILKKDLQSDKKQGKNIEDEIDEQRSHLPQEKLKGTPVTLERFQEWKKQRLLKKQKDEEEKISQIIKQSSSKGKMHGLSGRALFKFDPTLFVDDEEAAEGTDLLHREDEQSEEEGDEEQNYEQRRMEIAAQEELGDIQEEDEDNQYDGKNEQNDEDEENEDEEEQEATEQTTKADQKEETENEEETEKKEEIKSNEDPKIQKESIQEEEKDSTENKESEVKETKDSQETNQESSLANQEGNPEKLPESEEQGGQSNKQKKKKKNKKQSQDVKEPEVA